VDPRTPPPAAAARPDGPAPGAGRARPAEVVAAKARKLQDDKLLPPSLTIGALREEMRRSPKEDEREQLRAEREKLEATAAAIASARDELKKDTERLEALVQKVASSRSESKPGVAGSAAGGTGGGAAGTGATRRLPLDALAKSMRGMKPIEAAQIVARLPRPLAADILQRMPPADAGKVMGQMKPAEAAEVAAEIASRQPKEESRR
jgi:flagellar motility protein MotE (MotC chaperone)